MSNHYLDKGMKRSWIEIKNLRKDMVEKQTKIRAQNLLVKEGETIFMIRVLRI